MRDSDAERSCRMRRHKRWHVPCLRIIVSAHHELAKEDRSTPFCRRSGSATTQLHERRNRGLMPCLVTPGRSAYDEFAAHIDVRATPCPTKHAPRVLTCRVLKRVRASGAPSRCTRPSTYHCGGTTPRNILCSGASPEAQPCIVVADGSVELFRFLAGDDRGASSKEGKRRKKEGQGLGIELLTLRTGVVFVVALPPPRCFF